MLRYSYENINEMGEPYDKHNTLQNALTMLDEYPNDSVVITLTDDDTTPSDGLPQVMVGDSLLAAQMLRQCLYVLGHVTELRQTISAHAPAMLDQLDDILDMTKAIAGTTATEFIVNTYTIEEAADG